MPLAKPGRRLLIVAAARKLAEAEGLEALTLRRLAAELGIQAPSLYKHFPDKAALLAALEADLNAESGRLLAVWSQERGADLGRLARGYRRFAQEQRRLLPRLAPTADAIAAVSALAGGRDRALAFLAMADGLARLEAPESAWEAGVGTFEKGA